MKLLPLLLLLPVLLALSASSAPAPAPAPGDRALADYFRTETAALAGRCLSDIKSLDDWKSRREEYRRQLFEMVGLWPLPPRTDLKAVTTGVVEHPEFTIEKVQFQASPGLYVTGNLYVPKVRQGKLPAVLYVCGHGNVKKDGVSYGAKAYYQHHPIWFARHGYVSLVIDTVELAEIEGNHHGTNRDGFWWWNSRGYTPAGVEAWHCIRALDYLQSRPEVDGEKLGVTGRSGGGAYSWWIAALDERIKAAVPVAGITDLENHVVTGAVEGHCDCMYFVNTYRWDYPMVAALVAPRALLIGNSDKDWIFPLDGVQRLHAKAREIYRLYGAEDHLGLNITEGPHKDTQDLQVPAFRWFDRWLKGEARLIEKPAVKLFEPEQLKVFRELPSDQINTRIDHLLVKAAPAPKVPDSAADWAKDRDALLTQLRTKVFGGWPAETASLRARKAFDVERQGIRLSAYDFSSQPNVDLRVYLAQPAGELKPELCVLNVLDDAGWKNWLAGMRPGFEEELKGEPLPEADSAAFAENQKQFQTFKWGMAYLAPRGVGPAAWNPDPKKQLHIRRRFALLGQTREGMRVWDVRRAVQALRTAAGLDPTPLWLQGDGDMAGVALYASLFEPRIARLDLWNLPKSHMQGPELLNVLQVLDLPRAVALAAERSKVKLYVDDKQDGWEYPQAVARKLGWPAGQVEVRVVPAR